MLKSSRMFLPQKTSIILFFTIMTLGLGLFGVVSSGATEPNPSRISAISGISAMIDNPAPQPPVKKFAVVIGIVYDNNKLGRVEFADRDAASVYGLLTERMGFPRENVILLQNRQATFENITKALQWLSENPEIDSRSDVVFYYSGHGLTNGPGLGLNWPLLTPGYALVPFDFLNFDYKTGSGLFWDWDIADYLSRINPGRMWITIDSCNSGGFERPGITGPNRVVTLSSQYDQLSGEIKTAGRGVFTHFFIDEGVAKGLPVEKAFWASAPWAATPYGQNPQIADNYVGDLDFSQPPAQD